MPNMPISVPMKFFTCSVWPEAYATLFSCTGMLHNYYTVAYKKQRHTQYGAESRNAFCAVLCMKIRAFGFFRYCHFQFSASSFPLSKRGRHKTTLFTMSGFLQDAVLCIPCFRLALTEYADFLCPSNIRTAEGYTSLPHPISVLLPPRNQPLQRVRLET